jgi:hypothetical protein
MHKRFVLIGAATLAAALAPVAARAQVPQPPICGSTSACGQIKSDNTAYGTTAAEFLLLPATARGAALGGSYSALVTDVSSVFFNPAGLSQMDHAGLMASTMNYVAGTRYAFGAIAFPFSGGARALGVSVTNFGFSNQPVYTVEDPTGTSGEVYSVSETAVGLTYSQQFSDRFSAGFTGKLVNDQLGNVSGNAFAVDFGTSFHALIGGRAIRASFVIQNLGTTLSHSGHALDALVFRTPPNGEQTVAQEPARATLQTKAWPLPIMFRVALSYDLFSTQAAHFALLGEFTQPNNSNPGFNFGGEYGMQLGSSGFSVAGRAGMVYAPDNNLRADTAEAGFATTVKEGQMIRASAGGGLYYRGGGTFGIGVDYAYRNMGLLGGVNMFTLGLNF